MNKTMYHYNVAKDLMSIGIEMNCTTLPNYKFITIKHDKLIVKTLADSKKKFINLGGIIEKKLIEKETNDWYITSSVEYISKKISKAKRLKVLDKYKNTNIINEKDLFPIGE